MKADLAGSPAK